MIDLKSINKLAVPAIIYNIIEPLIGIVDTAVIGNSHADSVTAQAGIGIAAGLISTLVWGLAQVRTAISSLVSRALGANKLDKISGLAPQSLYFSLALGIVTAALTAFFFSDLSHFLYGNQSRHTQIYANDYYQIRALGLPLSLAVAGFFGIFRGLQNTTYAMTAAIIGGLVNVSLDLLLTQEWFGFTNWGVEGVAWASVISQFTMALVCIYFYLRKTDFNFKFSLNLHPQFLEMLGIAGNMFLRTIALNLAFLLALRYANGYGKATLTAYTIGIQIWLFSSFFIDGFSNAGNALAGKILGMNDMKMLKAVGKKLALINLSIAALLGLVYSAFYYELILLFTDNTEVIKAFNNFFWIIIVAQPLNSIAFTFDGVFKGLGDAKYLRNTLALGTFLIFIPILLILDYYHFEIFSVWIAFLAWMLFRGVSLVFKFYLKVTR